MDLLGPGHPKIRCRAALPGFLLLLCLLLAGCAPRSTVQPAPIRSTPALPSEPSPTFTPLPAPPTPVLPAPTPAPSACLETTGRVERRQIDSPDLPRPLRVTVYLPPCYSTTAAPAYPLLLMLHGQAADASQWERLGLFRAADRLAALGRITPPVIALPQEDDTLGNPFESGYDRALVDDLLPWLRAEYHACPRRHCTLIGGLSRGAAWAMYLGLSRPGVFAAVGAHSFPSFYGDENRLPLLLREIPAGQMPRIWMDTGERDRYLSQARHYHELLAQYHVPHEWTLYPGEHDEAYWSDHVEHYLLWYSPSGKDSVK